MDTIEYTQEPTGKYTKITVNGKAAKPASLRGWNKARLTPYWALLEEGHTFTNPFSGVRVALNKLESTIYNWCVCWYSRYERGKETYAPVQVYDDMKYFLLELNSQAYMDLID